MTRDEIMQMKAGLELSRLLAVNVMGWELKQPPQLAPRWFWYYKNDVRGPNTEEWRPWESIADAWQVLLWARRQTFSKRRRFKRALQDCVSHRLGTNAPILAGEVVMRMEPEDICRAALLATLEDE